MYVVTAKEMRELEQLTIDHTGIPSSVLMERAGGGATEVLVKAFPQVDSALVLVFAGKGNNGGDGFVIARALKKQGIACEVFLAAKKEEVTGDALHNLTTFVRLRGRVTEITDSTQYDRLQRQLGSCGLIVDALLGTGLNAPVRGLMADLIEMINASGVPVLAVDIPSGLDADRGVVLGSAIKAALTVTFGYPKLGLVGALGLAQVGRLEVVDIGIAPEALATINPRTTLLTKADMGTRLRGRHANVHKGDFGHLLVIAGARGKSGAALMSGGAALRMGTGLVTLGGPASLNTVFSTALMEAMTVPLPEQPDGSLSFDEQAIAEAVQGKSAIAFGPGVGVSTDTIGVLRWLVMRSEQPLVIDADGLNCLATDPELLREATVPVVLTPHPGEMARLGKSSNAEVQEHRLEVARAFATQHDCYVVLKGARTVIAAPDGKAWINPTGNPGMASGGMGDVLTGVIGGLLAQGYSPTDACCLGVFLHGHVGDRAAQEKGEIGILARDLIEQLPMGIRDLQQSAR
ncbi:MAG: NAD(P)H-hydrate dehydratase [Deltaproteobacteria bacterium]|nr:NAD(P)H-hydrate dehydratase [Deltaproteobacteria bacterium]